MPVVTIVGNPNISVENRREMVKKVPIEAITVLVEALPPESIGVAGELLSDRK